MSKKAKENTITHKVVLALGIISVLFIILFSTVFSSLYNINYYDKKYEQNNVYERFEKQTAINATNNLFGFFKDKNELDMTFFNEQEASHLLDVKILLQKIQLIYYLALSIFWIILIMVYLFKRKYFVNFFAQLMLYSGVFAVSLIVILGFLYLFFGFDFLFLKFHELFFRGNYAFDPRVSNMKALYPDEFFRDFGLKIVLTTVLKGLGLGFFGYFFMKKFK